MVLKANYFRMDKKINKIISKSSDQTYLFIRYYLSDLQPTIKKLKNQTNASLIMQKSTIHKPIFSEFIKLNQATRALNFNHIINTPAHQA